MPYWCGLIPKEAFRRVTGVVGNFIESSSSSTADDGTCILRDLEGHGELGVGWSLIVGKDVIAKRIERIRTDNVMRSNPKTLPSRLGSGFTAYASSEDESAPYVVAAVFRCGRREPMINIDLHRVSQRRNATKDLTDLMRIAQNRFGEFHHCSPGPL
jgi:hypothetical protein